MKTRAFFGRCNILISVTGLMVIVLWALPVVASPVGVDAEVALDIAEGGWTEVVGTEGRVLPLDEQIFTELSPIVATDNGVKLPEDQEEE